MTTTTIAKRAKVSQATVSRVLNGGVNVSTKTFEQVVRVVEEMGYQHMLRPRYDSGGNIPQAGLVAALILTHDEFHNYASTCWLMLQGAQQALQRSGMGLVMAHVLNTDNIPPVVAEERVKGLLLIGQHPEGSILDRIANMPKVWLTTRHEKSGDFAVPGNEQVGRIAAEYLLQRGHKRLGVLDTLLNSPAIEIRRQYFCFTAMQSGVPVDKFVAEQSVPSLDEPLNLEILEARVTAQVDRFLAANPRPTGLFVPMDMQLAMVYRVLAKRGVRVGRDLEMIGSDDEKAALIGLYPRPATISIGPNAMGRRAVEQLLWRISNRNVKERVRVTVEPELIPGDDVR